MRRLRKFSVGRFRVVKIWGPDAGGPSLYSWTALTELLLVEMLSTGERISFLNKTYILTDRSFRDISSVRHAESAAVLCTPENEITSHLNMSSKIPGCCAIASL